ncbi:DUF3331 domain-containing protein [Paraburkholderia phytofirmans]|uniref:DUF3331 domain-containing protein n=1 Tax=Paraburkholderia phytofirmans TaxID=261302 RepID=UPI0009EF61D2
MQRKPRARDVWDGILSLLEPRDVDRNGTLKSAAPEKLKRERVRCERNVKPRRDAARRDCRDARNRFIRVIDGPCEGKITVSWHDSQHCHYEEQTWRIGTAVQNGNCALSGQSIIVGDAVFRPFGRPRSSNADEMILVRVLTDLSGKK